jgi:hypothetical protein
MLDEDSDQGRVEDSASATSDIGSPEDPNLERIQGAMAITSQQENQASAVAGAVDTNNRVQFQTEIYGRDGETRMHCKVAQL